MVLTQVLTLSLMITYRSCHIETSHLFEGLLIDFFRGGRGSKSTVSLSLPESISFIRSLVPELKSRFIIQNANSSKQRESRQPSLQTSANKFCVTSQEVCPQAEGADTDVSAKYAPNSIYT